jgi:hypothetical protein
MESLVKLFMSLTVAATMWELLGWAMAFGTLDDFGRSHEWWGVPNRFVEFRSFGVHDTNDYITDHPHVSGVLRNNYDRPLTTFWFDLDYYRCPTADAVRHKFTDVTGCNRVWSDGTGTELPFEVHLGIGPHSEAPFRLDHSLFAWSDLQSRYGGGKYFIRAVPQITRTY